MLLHILVPLASSQVPNPHIQSFSHRMAHQYSVGRADVSSHSLRVRANLKLRHYPTVTDILEQADTQKEDRNPFPNH